MKPLDYPPSTVLTHRPVLQTPEQYRLAPATTCSKDHTEEMRKKYTSGSIDLRQRALQAQFTRTLSSYTMTQNRRNAN